MIAGLKLDTLDRWLVELLKIRLELGTLTGPMTISESRHLDRAREAIGDALNHLAALEPLEFEPKDGKVIPFPGAGGHAPRRAGDLARDALAPGPPPEPNPAAPAPHGDGSGAPRQPSPPPPSRPLSVPAGRPLSSDPQAVLPLPNRVPPGSKR